VKLPDFLLVGGTVGKPTPDKRKLLVLGTSAVGGIVNAFQGGGNVGNLIQGAGNLLGGNKSAQAGTNASGTATSNSPTGRTDLLKGFNSILGGGRSNAPTNESSTNQPATNKSSTSELLNDLFKPKKQ